MEFETSELGPYTYKAARKEWGKVSWAQLSERVKVVRDQDPQFGKVLKVTYPKGSLGPKQGGGQFLVPLPPSEELWLSYYIKFDNQFDFKKGGKLPGLTSGGSKYTGGLKPTKGQGWSARFMWKEGGRAIVYLYYVDMPGKWGDNLLLKGFTFTPGSWHHITQHIKVNTADEANGVIEVWIDDEKLLSR